MIVVTTADGVLVTKLTESHSEVIIMHINVEEVEDEMEPRRRQAEQMVCGCWTAIVHHYHLNTATASNQSRVA